MAFGSTDVSDVIEVLRDAVLVLLAVDTDESTLSAARITTEIQALDEALNAGKFDKEL